MKTKEFRIGNYARNKATHELLEIVELNEEGIAFYVVDRSKYPLPKGWQAEPIPLTKEWLLKFAFSFYEKLSGLIGFELDGWFLTEEFEFMILGLSISLSKLKYVHQLQNLYFALEEKELIIKTKPNGTI